LNLLTATEPCVNTREGPLPLALPSDREAMEVGLFSALPRREPRICRIRNTALVDELWVSESMLSEVKRNPQLDLIAEPMPFPFDDRGNLF